VVPTTPREERVVRHEPNEEKERGAVLTSKNGGGGGGSVKPGEGRRPLELGIGAMESQGYEWVVGVPVGGGVVAEEKNRQRGSVPFLKPWWLDRQEREGATVRRARRKIKNGKIQIQIWFESISTKSHLPKLKKIEWKYGVAEFEVKNNFCYCDFPRFELNLELKFREAKRVENS
jgi:hypothetical protein